MFSETKSIQLCVVILKNSKTHIENFFYTLLFLLTAISEREESIMSRPQISQFEKGRIIGMLECGKSIHKVAGIFERSRSTISTIWKPYI